MRLQAEATFSPKDLGNKLADGNNMEQAECINAFADVLINDVPPKDREYQLVHIYPYLSRAAKDLILEMAGIIRDTEGA